MVVVEGHPFDDDDEQQTSDRLRAFGVYRQYAAGPTCDNQHLPASRNTNIFCLKNAFLDGFGFDQYCPSCPVHLLDESRLKAFLKENRFVIIMYKTLCKKATPTYKLFSSQKGLFKKGLVGVLDFYLHNY